MLRVAIAVLIVVSTSFTAWAQPAPSDAGVPDAPPADAPPANAPPSDAPPPQAAQPAQPPPCKGTIDVHAVDASTHEPVVAATIRMGDTMIGTTDEAGRFTLTAQCPGSVTVIVEREDYKPAERTISLGEHASLEIEMTIGGEVIEIREKAPPPPEMRSAAVL